jgi:dolichol-phosphate mannosyltransferase
MSDYKDFTVVLPTLNEEATIGVLIKKLAGALDGVNIVVVDDGSGDGTRKAVESFRPSSGKVSFIDRKAMGCRPGLTASVSDGILGSTTKYAIVMDADLQHPPETAKRIADALRKGNGLAVAIRADVRKWQLYRKVISKSLITLGYAVLVLRGSERCSDIFSGFFGIDRSLFKKAYTSNKGRFVGGGYKVLFDFLKCNRSGSLRIAEIPYSFGVRRHGTSKAGMKQGLYLLESFLK